MEIFSTSLHGVTVARKATVLKIFSAGLFEVTIAKVATGLENFSVSEYFGHRGNFLYLKFRSKIVWYGRSQDDCLGTGLKNMKEGDCFGGEATGFGEKFSTGLLGGSLYRSTGVDFNLTSRNKLVRVGGCLEADGVLDFSNNFLTSTGEFRNTMGGHTLGILWL